MNENEVEIIYGVDWDKYFLNVKIDRMLKERYEKKI